MITNIKVTDKEIEDILLFDEINNVTKFNILYGGNGVGKTTLLNSIRNGKVELETNNNIIIKSYSNSEDNSNLNIRKEILEIDDFVRTSNGNTFSEGQRMIHHLLPFLQELEELDTGDKSLVVLLDEIDSGLSAENLNMILIMLIDLIKNKNAQIFISTNHYHFTYAVKTVLDMYTGKYRKINSYEEFYNGLVDGIRISKESNKRDFKFLKVIR